MDVRTDELTRRLYAADASMYEEVPNAVAFPKSADEISELVRKAKSEGFHITPRAAGTSLAGQATGSSMVMDISRFMDQITEIKAEENWALVQPGVIRDTLNREAGNFGLQFGPDTSTTNRCMIGGMIGNNSAGSFSIKYQTTREHVLEMDAVLSDGSKATFKALNEEELNAKLKLQNLEGDIYRGVIKIVDENIELIKETYPHPEIIRRNTGYALDKLAEMKPFNATGRDFNMCELLCGSEGTLAITTSAKLNLVPTLKHKILLIPHFKNLNESLKATIEIVNFDVSAVELVDKVILDATKENFEQQKNRFFISGEPKCILVVEMEGDDLTELKERAELVIEKLKTIELGYAYTLVDDPEKMKRVWDLRKAGLGLLMGLVKDSRTPTFCEDTAVRVQDLPDYINDFDKILDKHNTSCVYYAHASVGELHLRPMIDITTEEGLKTMDEMAIEIADLVKSYGGSLSGEHGDGRARSPYLERVFGNEVMAVLREVKEIFDPHFILNPAKIINPEKIDAGLRYSPTYNPPNVETVFKWRKAGGFARASELCNGAGVCRKLADSGGTMCPSYMATKDEQHSTRGRANVFRQLFSGKEMNAFSSEDLKSALDLCLSCKACKSECPANVDMAAMKAEFMNGWHREKGSSFSEKLFSNLDKHYKLASKFPALTNFLSKNAIFRKILENTTGMDERRSLPSFAEKAFSDWFHTREDGLESEDKVILFLDLFTNYHEPEIAKAATLSLEALGYQVELFPNLNTGRPQISLGFLDQAKQICHEVINALEVKLDEGYQVVGLEPSEILTLRDDYLELCDDEFLHLAQKLSNNTYLFDEFICIHHERIKKLDLPQIDQKLVLHGHCHQKALVGNAPTVEMLKLFGYEVEDLNTGCCGMAGSFGYEKNKYDLSMDIGELKLFPALRETSNEILITAPGFSCRHQIKDGVSREAQHPAELVYRRIQANKKKG